MKSIVKWGENEEILWWPFLRSEIESAGFKLSTCEDDYIEIAWIYQFSILKAGGVVRMGGF